MLFLEEAECPHVTPTLLEAGFAAKSLSEDEAQNVLLMIDLNLKCW